MKKQKRYNTDLETLRRWKQTSAKATLDWLQDALLFLKAEDESKNTHPAIDKKQ